MNSPAPDAALSAVPALPVDAVCLADYARLARARLDARVWAYFEGGAADELTLAENQRAWQSIALQPRVLDAAGAGQTRCTVLGRTCAHPLMLAPVAYQRLAHPHGELGTAYAAAAQGAGMVLSAQASTLLEDVAAAIVTEPGRGPLWFQLYVQPEGDETRALIARAEAAGYEALVITVDAPVHGARDRERRAGFVLPPDVSAVNLSGPPTAPADGVGLCGGLVARAPRWPDLAALVAQTRLPVLLKGILHPDDARRALDIGAAGIIVSNHGGRTLDTAPATAPVLPRLRAAVGASACVLVDGGIRRGTDVLKALALGADAVMIGRPYVHALAAAGAMGVAHVIRLLRDELEMAMALTGCLDLAAVGPQVLFDPALGRNAR